MKNRLKELRMENNLTLIELGKQLMMKNSTLSQYETGKREPSIETLKNIAQVLDCTVDNLIKNKEE